MQDQIQTKIQNSKLRNISKHVGIYYMVDCDSKNQWDKQRFLKQCWTMDNHKKTIALDLYFPQYTIINFIQIINLSVRTIALKIV